MSNTLTDMPARACLRAFARLLPYVFVTLTAATPAQANPADSELGTVNVTATREHEMIREAETTTMSTITAQEISERQVRNIKDLVRYEPGVSVTNNPTRFGLSGFNIRGLDDNYILMSVDGIRLPNNFKIGGHFNTGRDMVDVGMLTALDIVRGTGSTVHGVDALGGVAAYRTLRPEDLLAGQNVAVSTEAQYATVNHSRSWLVGAALGNDVVQFLVKGVARRGHETETQGTIGGAGGDRTIANPQDVASDAALVHLTLTPVAGHRSDLTVETFDRTIDTHDYSQIRIVKDDDLRAHDTYRRRRISLDHRISDLPFGTLNIKTYRQESEVRQFARTQLKDLGPFANTYYASGTFLVDPDRWEERSSLFRQDISGLRLDATSAFSAWGRHALGWGAEYSVMRTEQLRDGHMESESGIRINSVYPLDYPSRDFPLSKTRRVSLFAQDEWMLSDTWSLMFGARYDTYRLTVTNDEIFEKNPYGAEQGNVSMKKFVPKTGAVWRIGNGFSLASNYAFGFRPPPYEEANTAFSNPNQGVAFIPNPNLKAETARQFELSLRHNDSAGDWAITWFDNRYRDFLDTEETNLSGSACTTSPKHPLCRQKPGTTGFLPTDYYTSIYQTVNLDRVRIHGIEARLSRELHPGWRLRAAVTYTRGRDLETGESICRINPPSGVLGLSHERGAWRAEAVVSGALPKRKKDAKQITNQADGSQTTDWDCGRQFLPEGYHTVDFYLHWQFARTGRLSLGANNLLDATYYQWADAPLCDPNHIVDSCKGMERYSQPGRNLSLSVNYVF